MSGLFKSDVARLFKSKIFAIAHLYLASDPDAKLKAPAPVAALQAPIIARPHMRPAVALEAAAAAPLAAAAADSDANGDRDVGNEGS